MAVVRLGQDRRFHLIAMPNRPSKDGVMKIRFDVDRIPVKSQQHSKRHLKRNLCVCRHWRTYTNTRTNSHIDEMSKIVGKKEQHVAKKRDIIRTNRLDLSLFLSSTFDLLFFQSTFFAVN